MIASRWSGVFGLRRVVLRHEEHNFSQPECEKVPNHGRASAVKSRLSFDATDECPSETGGPQHAFASGPLKRGVKRVRGPEKHVGVRRLEEDEGYSSPFSRATPPQPAFSGATSSPPLGPKTGFHPDGSKSRWHDQLPPPWKEDFFADDGWGVVVAGSDWSHMNASVASVEDHWDGANIGWPLLESSVCDTLRAHLNDGREHTGEVQEHLEPVHECWTTLDEQDFTLDPGYETTLPLQAKVKSVAVVTGRPPHPSGNPPSQRACMARREVDWEREKRLYLDSVKKHISDNQGRRRDVMTELVTLMAGTNCSPGSSSPRPQHPSDFTRRNYQRRLSDLVPSVTLQEWEAANNCQTGKRFAGVSNQFRSPFAPF